MAERPKIIVFDLDYTLWPFWIDTHVTPPFKKRTHDEIIDAQGKSVRYYKDVPGILKELSDKGYELGIASRTSEIKGARQLLGLLGWQKYFKYTEIFPGNKVTHFSNIQKASQVSYEDMLFFDDEHRNIRDVSTLGVHAILVTNGVTYAAIENGLKSFRK